MDTIPQADQAVLTQEREETTLVSDPLPACLPADSDWPTDYASVRITVAHVDVRVMLTQVFEGIEYICYKHKGQKTKKEHVHVIVTDLTKDNTIRKRLAKNGYKGNQTFSFKVFHNGLLAGIRYCAKEGTAPFVVGDFERAIAAAPKWEHKQTRLESYAERKSATKNDRDWSLTYSNLVPQAVLHAQSNNLTEHSLKHVVRDMMEKTKWKPCHQMYKCGVSPVYEEDFKVRVGREKTYEMKWWDNYTKYN